SRPDKDHQGCCRNRSLYLCKAQDNKPRLMGNRQGIQRRLLEKPVQFVRKLRRNPNTALKATLKDAPPNRLFDKMAAAGDPDAPSRQPALEIRYHSAIRTNDETYKLVDGAPLTGCDAHSLSRRGRGGRFQDR